MLKLQVYGVCVCVCVCVCVLHESYGGHEQ